MVYRSSFICVWDDLKPFQHWEGVHFWAQPTGPRFHHHCIPSPVNSHHFCTACDCVIYVVYVYVYVCVYIYIYVCIWSSKTHGYKFDLFFSIWRVECQILRRRRSARCRARRGTWNVELGNWWKPLCKIYYKYMKDHRKIHQNLGKNLWKSWEHQL